MVPSTNDRQCVLNPEEIDRFSEDGLTTLYTFWSLQGGAGSFVPVKGEPTSYVHGGIRDW